MSCVKAAEWYFKNGIVVTHDKINLFLTRHSLTPETLWNEVERYVEKRSGVSKLGGNWFSRIKKNRMVNPDDKDNRPVSSLVIPDDGLTVHMEKSRFVRVFHSVNKDRKGRFWASHFLTMDHQMEEPPGYVLVYRKLISRPQGVMLRRGL